MISLYTFSLIISVVLAMFQFALTMNEITFYTQIHNSRCRSDDLRVVSVIIIDAIISIIVLSGVIVLISKHEQIPNSSIMSYEDRINIRNTWILYKINMFGAVINIYFFDHNKLCTEFLQHISIMRNIYLWTIITVCIPAFIITSVIILSDYYLHNPQQQNHRNNADTIINGGIEVNNAVTV